MHKRIVFRLFDFIAIALLTSVSGNALAGDGYQNWATEITCGEQNFTLMSVCLPSIRALTMNTCKDEQTLTKKGRSSRRLPLPQTKETNGDLRATRWKCRLLDNRPYLEIAYAAGLGNIPNNEAVEHYDLDLHPISDPAVVLNILRKGVTGNKGHVKSIMHDDDSPSPDDRTTNSAVEPHTDWRSIVIALRDQPSVLTKDWPAYRRILPIGCFQNDNSNELSCPPIQGIKRIFVHPGLLGGVDIVLESPASCEAIHDLLNPRFGPGKIRNQDLCSANWDLRFRIKGAYVDMRRNRKDPSLIQLQFAIEQGP